jgi:hypothetical protein
MNPTHANIVAITKASGQFMFYLSQVIGINAYKSARLVDHHFVILRHVLNERDGHSLSRSRRALILLSTPD